MGRYNTDAVTLVLTDFLGIRMLYYRSQQTLQIIPTMVGSVVLLHVG